MQNIKGKVALVTGASKGLGYAIAMGLAQEGVHVAITSRNLDEVNAAKEKISQEISDSKIIAIKADMAVEEDIQQMVNTVTSELGEIDILINNAGQMDYTPFMESSEARFREMMETNVFGMYRAMKLVLPSMQQRQTGDIINVSSMSGLKGTKGSALYSATKYAVIGLSEGAMQDVRTDNVRISTITPSAILTDRTRGKLKEESMMHASDVADIIVNQLKLEQRTLMKTSQMWATNPIPLDQ